MEKYRGMDSNELANKAEEVIGEMRRKAYAEGYEQGKYDEKMNKGFKSIGDALRSADIPTETSQEKRDRIVKQAKDDVEELTKYDKRTIRKVRGFGIEPYYDVREYFIVNKEKRTVVCLLRGADDYGVYSRGIAKCAPTDCFNVHIGKSIALRRAMGLEVPDEYLNTPQPTEVRVGDVVEYEGYRVKIISNEGRMVLYTEGLAKAGSIVAKQGTIIDDSREEVES